MVLRAGSYFRPYWREGLIVLATLGIMAPLALAPALLIRSVIDSAIPDARFLLLLALAGGILGVVPTAIVMSLADVQIVPFGPIRRPEVSLFAVLASLSIAVLVGVGAGLWPAYRAIRLRPVDALRRLG